MRTQSTCSVPGCERRVVARGWCSMHYQRMKRHGSTHDPRPTAEGRFWSKVNKNGPVSDYRPTLGPCWLWTGARSGAGYGHRRVGGHYVDTHRFAYELLIGPIPAGLELDHLCRIRLCVNINHLEPVTRQVNIQRGISANGIKTHCLWGHPFDADNTYWYKGRRICRACNRKHHLKHRPNPTLQSDPR
jgi:hypothetical protein